MFSFTRHSRNGVQGVVSLHRRPRPCSTFRLRKAIARCKHESRGRTWELVVVTATDRIDTLIARSTRLPGNNPIELTDWYRERGDCWRALGHCGNKCGELTCGAGFPLSFLRLDSVISSGWSTGGILKGISSLFGISGSREGYASIKVSRYLLRVVERRFLFLLWEEGGKKMGREGAGGGISFRFGKRFDFTSFVEILKSLVWRDI